MKINNVYDLCKFLNLSAKCGNDTVICGNCPLNYNISEKIKGELEVVEECEHDWRYSVSDVNTIYYSVLRECDLCGDDDYLAIKKHELTKLFED